VRWQEDEGEVEQLREAEGLKRARWRQGCRKGPAGSVVILRNRDGGALAAAAGHVSAWEREGERDRERTQDEAQAASGEKERERERAGGRERETDRAMAKGAEGAESGKGETQDKQKNNETVK